MKQWFSRAFRVIGLTHALVMSATRTAQATGQNDPFPNLTSKTPYSLKLIQSNIGIHPKHFLGMILTTNLQVIGKK